MPHHPSAADGEAQIDLWDRKPEPGQQQYRNAARRATNKLSMVFISDFMPSAGLALTSATSSSLLLDPNWQWAELMIMIMITTRIMTK